MKLALILLVCCVGISYQQGYGWIPLSYRYSPRFLYPDYNQLDVNVQASQASLEFQPSLSLFDEDGIDSVLGTQARVPFNNADKIGKKPQTKFFGQGFSLIPNSVFPLFSNFRTLAVTTFTTTVISTVSSTAIVATMQACIPASLFVTQAGLVTLTNQCRRKRDAVEFERHLKEVEDSISPSAVVPLSLTTIEPRLVENHKPEIASSHFDLLDQNNQFYGDGRQNRALNLIVTTTAVVTTYSFSTTTIKRTVNLSSPNALSCLPSGYSIC